MNIFKYLPCFMSKLNNFSLHFWIRSIPTLGLAHQPACLSWILGGFAILCCHSGRPLPTGQEYFLLFFVKFFELQKSFWKFIDQCLQYHYEDGRQTSTQCPCTFCGQIFEHEADLTSHVRAHHKQLREGFNKKTLNVMELSIIFIPSQKLQR